MPVLPDTDPPFFFRRVWAGGTPLDEVTLIRHQSDGSVLIAMGVPEADAPPLLPDELVATLAFDGLVIYGRAVTTPDDPHDLAMIRGAAERGLVFSECFSTVVPFGELGTHPLAAVSEISREAFEAARAHNWEIAP